ncbi:site-specific DNA-methyltransferase (adenine-specific) [Nocardioides sp. BE266]|uniref:DNA-methyltransferase n=1 Tax=Nocardioides sp. BE266 TaxID=2817725 RepID=UPI0028544475|nr:site-specific DNA-methyltransferase [Nocardioides sp. BE266]MDR7252771.1 site-specific DNA-methyltransferase (adenine-specific) [Nocardioides sp. BE266]
MAYPLPTALNPIATWIGDSLTVLRGLPDQSVDSVVTDPPYAIRRLPRSISARPAARREDCPTTDCSDDHACRDCTQEDLINKYSDAPMLGQQSQNWHATATHSRGYADNDPQQFQEWCSLWLNECWRILKPGGHLVAFGGTRTWHRLTCAAEDSGFEIRDSMAWLYSSGMPKSQNIERALLGKEPTPADQAAAKIWAGWGTTLKPAFEPIVLARRPLDGTMANNLRTWGVGPINLNAHPAVDNPAARQSAKWPTNVALDADQARQMADRVSQDPSDFFWVSKPNKTERVVIDGVAHPTVKPLDLLRRLVTRVTPPGGLVLDPFAGSGTTIEACALDGFRAIAIERDPRYRPLIEARLARVARTAPAPTGDVADTLCLF